MAEANASREFQCRKALQTLVIEFLVALISIAFNVPRAEALALLNQWIVAFIQLATSTGLIALFEFWYKALWRRSIERTLDQKEISAFRYIS